MALPVANAPWLKAKTRRMPSRVLWDIGKDLFDKVTIGSQRNLARALE